MQAKTNASQGNPQAFRSDDGKSQNIDTMLDFNSLQYEMFPDLSVATDRTYKRHPFQKTSYNHGETAFCIINSGADFVDPRNSYLRFTIVPQTTDLAITTRVGDQPYFGALGSVLDVIRSVTITDRAGNEIERIHNAGMLGNILLRNSYSESWFRTYGHLLGARSTNEHSVALNSTTFALAGTDDTAATPTQALNFGAENGLSDFWPAIWAHQSISEGTTTAKAGIPRGYCIPLRFLSGLWDYNQLLPSQLCSGMRFEIQFQNKERSFTWGGATTDSNGQCLPTAITLVKDGVKNSLAKYNYTFEGVELVLDSVKLTDSIQRELNERASNDGLEIMFRTWWTSSYTGTSSKEVWNIEVRKAVSRAFGAIAHFAPVYKDSLDEASIDVNMTHNYGFEEWQWRAGNLYFPHQVMRRSGYTKEQSDVNNKAAGSIFSNPQTPGSAETFIHMQRLFGKNVEQNSENDMNQSLYQQVNKSGAGYSEHHNYDYTRRSTNYALVPLDLERTTVQDLSGIPLNNSRVLALQFRLADLASRGDVTYKLMENTNQGTLTTFLQHLKIVRVFMDNTEIEE